MEFASKSCEADPIGLPITLPFVSNSNTVSLNVNVPDPVGTAPRFTTTSFANIGGALDASYRIVRVPDRVGWKSPTIAFGVVNETEFSDVKNEEPSDSGDD